MDGSIDMLHREKYEARMLTNPKKERKEKESGKRGGITSCRF